LAAAEAFQTECRLRGRDGQYRWFVVQAEPLFDARGEVAQWTGTCIDIEQQLGAERAKLQLWEQRFRASVEGLIGCFALYTAIRDAAGRITDFRVDDVNQSACHDIDLLREEQVGRTLLEIVPGHRESGLFLSFCEVVESGEPSHGENVRYEVDHGTARVARAMEIRATKLGDGVVAAWRDITRRAKAEQELRDREERLRIVFDQAAVGIAHVALDGRWIRPNRRLCEILGYSEEELTARTFQDVTHPDDLEVDLEHVRRLLAGEERTYSMEKRYVCKGGAEVWVSLTVTLVRDEDGVPRQFLSIVEDISDRKRTEQALRESEERYRSLFTTMTEGFFLGQILCDDVGLPVDFIFSEINPAFERHAGLKREQVVGRRVKQVLPNVEDYWIDEFGAVALTGEPRQFTNYSRGLDRHFRVAAFSPARGQFAVLFLNVNEQIRTRQALEETGRRLRAVLDVLPMPLFLTDTGGRVTEANPAAQAFWGSAPLSRGPDDYARDYRAWWPDTGRRVESHEWGMSRALASGEQVLAEEMEVEIASGERRRIHNYAVPIRDDAGAITGGVCVNVDVTEMRRGELRLRESETLFRKLAEANLVGVGFGNATGNLLYVNDELLRMMGRTRAEFESGPINWSDAIAPEYADADRADLERLILTGQSKGTRKAFLRPDGGRTPFLGAAAFMDDGQTRVSLAADLTAIERAEAALREADRRKDDFLAMLGHELRNPLAAISSAIQLQRLPGIDAQQAEAGRRVIDHQTRQLVRLVDDLMDVSRISQGKIRLRRERLDAVPVLLRAADAARVAMEQRQHRFSISLPKLPVPVEVDAARLEQMTVNLLYNAAKYTEPGGTVSLTASASGGALVIRVRDNGVGIAAEMQERIFEPFTQVDSSLARSQGGLGLGLALVRRLAELHGGRVSVHSEGSGRGSEFSVTLPPLPAAEPTSQGDEPGAWVAPPGRRGERILIVDDNRDTAMSTEMFLKLKGYQVYTTHDGKTALAAARSFRPDVVLLDIGLPGMNGYEVARRLRSDEALGDILLIAASGYGLDQDRARSRAAGMDDHLVKPLDLDALPQLLARIREQRKTP
jgi:PAS domain S-box-containing protein